MQLKNVNIYVGCALTHASQSYKTKIKTFKNKLRKIPRVTVLEFCPPAKGERQSSLPAKVVFENDIEGGVEQADIVITEVSLSSLGLGVELSVAIRERKVPTIMFIKKRKHLSKLIQGMSQKYPHVSLLLYRFEVSSQ
jgi:hypothetical protein